MMSNSVCVLADITAVCDGVSLHAPVGSLGEGDVPGQPHSLLVGGKGDVIVLAQIGCLCSQHKSPDLCSEGCLP